MRDARCPGVENYKTPIIIDKICPNCGADVELFSVDTEMACENCGFVVYNDTMSCVKWCKYARNCFGDELYEKLNLLAKKEEIA